MKRNRSLLVIAIVLILSTLALVRPISAQSSCDAIVVDEVNVFKSRIEEVRAQAQALMNNSGAEVRVRTIQSYGSQENLDTYTKALGRSCPSWWTSGDFKNNMVILIISIKERQTGVYAGSQWANPLGGPTIPRIRNDIMGTRFANGDFVGGFVEGMKEIDRLLNGYLHPAPPVQAQPPVVVVVPTSQPVPVQPVQPAQPVDLSGLWRVLLIIVVVGAGGGVVFVVYRVVVGVTTANNRRRAAQQKALVARQAVASRITDWQETSQQVQLGIETLAGQADEENETFKANLAKAQSLVDRAAEQFKDASHSAGDPSRPGLTVDEYEAMENAFSAILESLTDAGQIASSTLSQIEQLKQDIADAPKAVEAARAAYESAESQVAAIATQGFKTLDAEENLSQANTSLSQASSALDNKQFVSAAKKAKEAQELCDQAVTAANSLAETKAAIDGQITQASERVKTVQEAISQGRTIFDAISSQYAEKSWTSVRGNGTEATNRVNSSLAAMKLATTAASMENQEWQKAQEALGQIDVWLGEAESFMRSLVSLQQHLEAAARDAASEVQAAQADIKAAREYIAEFDDDIKESLETDLDQADEAVRQAEQELQSSKPDYLTVVKLAKQANESADNILVEARSEHEAAERLRLKAKTALRSATAAVSKADEYIEDHDTDVEHTAKKHLAKAKELLAEAEAAQNLDDVINNAKAAEKEADQAYEKAEEDFDAAEDARRPTVTSVNVYGGWGTSSSSHHSDDNNSSSIFGGSSPIGGSIGGSSGWSSPSPSPSIGGSSTWSTPSTPSAPSGGSVGGSSGW